MAQETIFRLFQKGRFYDFTVYTDPRTGRPVFRQRYNSKGKGIKYLSQQINRDRMAQLPARYRSMMPAIGEAFTDKPERQSSFNAFVAKNFSKVTTWLTKEEIDLGAAILEPMVISSGKLGEIGYDYSEDRQWVVTDIELDGLEEITADTTIGQLSRAITPKQTARVGRCPLNHNAPMSNRAEFFEGDELYFWRLHQDNSTSVPRVWAERRAVELNNNSDLKLWEQTGSSDGFVAVAVTKDGATHHYLGCQVVDETAVAWVHSTRRREYLKDPKDHVALSNQTTLGESSLVRVYSDSEAMLKAIESYGGVNRVNYYAPGPNGSDPESGSGNTGPTGGGPGTVHEVTVTCTVSGGHGTVTPASHTVTFGFNISFTAAPDEGYRPDWPNGSHDLTYTLQARESTNITLTFSPKTSGGGSNPGEDFGS